jgi:hypothetical protein
MLATLLNRLTCLSLMLCVSCSRQPSHFVDGLLEGMHEREALGAISASHLPREIVHETLCPGMILETALLRTA